MVDDPVICKWTANSGMRRDLLLRRAQMVCVHTHNTALIGETHNQPTLPKATYAAMHRGSHSLGRHLGLPWPGDRPTWFYRHHPHPAA